MTVLIYKLITSDLHSFNNIAPNGWEKSQSSFVSNGYPHTQGLLLILLMEGLVCENTSCDPAWVRYLLSYASFHNDIVSRSLMQELEYRIRSIRRRSRIVAVLLPGVITTVTALLKLYPD